MSPEATGDCSPLPGETEALLERHAAARDAHDDEFDAAMAVAPALGAHVRDGYATVGMWTPGVVDRGVPPEDVLLEVLTPPADVDPGETTLREIEFERSLVPTRREGEVTWAAVDGMAAGTRDRLGSLYQLVHDPDDTAADVAPDDVPGGLDADGLATVQDPLADSVPFGAFAPAELYDRDRLNRERADREYFEALGGEDERVSTTEDAGLPRVDPATSMLEIHPGTATESGSLGGLARLVEGVGEKRRAGEPLDAFEEHLVGYDAVQLMPVEPLTERSDADGYWRALSRDGDRATATAARPEQVNWGYDVVIRGFSAPNPAILESGRPDELVDLVAAFHTLPEPVRVVFDVALGHADDGALDVLPERFLHGPGMYGQHLDYLEPWVRTHVLEFQRRKMDWGADGIRVDGAQDFRNYDPETGEMEHDDELLALMDAVTQEVAGTEYRPWLVYEDGRPWPRHDWELASTYRTLIERHPHSFQWSPITFAHNKPALLTFWVTKWWRMREVADVGGDWITGVANHDTVRRGTQVEVPEGWEGNPINRYLGDSPPEILDRAYDNAATDALFHCFLPGVPMDFLNANARGPWGFVRDTDADWNVKVVADEHNLLDWQVRPEHYADERFFRRLKDLGFDTPEAADGFVKALAATVEPTDADLDGMAAMLSTVDLGVDPDAAFLQRFADAWMRDVAEFATLDHWRDDQDPERARLARETREFRQDRPWLRADLALADDGGSDRFAYRHPTDGAVVYYGIRTAPDGSERVLYVGNMEGVETTVTPAALLTDAGIEAESAAADAGPLDPTAFDPVIVPPGVAERRHLAPAVDEPLALRTGEAVVFVAGSDEQE